MHNEDPRRKHIHVARRSRAVPGGPEEDPTGGFTHGGWGERFFDVGTTPAGLRLLDSKVSGTGVTINVYERAGEIDTGSFEFEEPTEAELKRRERLATG